MSLMEAVRYWIAQLLGAIAAAFICLSLFNRDVIVNGTPQLNGNPALGFILTPGQGILIEAILTFFLVFVVHGTAVDERGRPGDWRDDYARHLVWRTADRCRHEPRARVWPGGGRQFLERSLRLLDRPIPWRCSRGSGLPRFHRA